MGSLRYKVQIADFNNDMEAIRAVRTAVFVTEQGIPPELEWDAADASAHHLLAVDQAGTAIATARLTPDGRIGRMAVVRERRGTGVGTTLLEGLLDLATALGLASVWLHAQRTAVTFYADRGFVTEGAEFIAAGIPHQRMLMSIGRRSRRHA